MAIVGRALRQQWRNEAFERAHPEVAQARIAQLKAWDELRAELAARWPTVTVENFAEIEAFRHRREREIEDEIRAKFLKNL